MKIRQGFVSNSSSSSFILSSKEDVPTIEIKIPVNKLSCYIKINTKEELQKEFLKNYTDIEYIMKDKKCNFEKAIKINNKYIESLYNDSLNEINDGKIIYMFEASNEYSDPYSNLIYEYSIPESNKYKIIKNG